MRIAVFSDTHRLTAPMVDAVSRCRPDAIIHLGDHDRDTGVLLKQFPEIPLPWLTSVAFTGSSSV